MAVKKTDVEEVADILQPELTWVTFDVGEGDDVTTFVQKPLSFFGKMEFFSFMGKTIEEVLSQDVSLDEILETNTGKGGEADAFIKSVSKIIQHVPELLGDLYCIILAVRREDREEIKELLEEHLDDDRGFQILETFIDQNLEVMTNFFKERAVPLFNKISQSLQK